MRCPECGLNNPAGALVCGRCGRSLREEEPQRPQSSRNYLEIGDREPIPYFPREDNEGQFSERSVESRNPLISSRTRQTEPVEFSPSRDYLQSNPDLVGTVILTEPIYYENPDFDGARFLNGLLLILEFLGLPLFLLWGFLNYFGPVSMILALMGLFFFFRFFLSPTNLLAWLGIFYLLNPFGRTRSRQEQVPVQYFRLRDSSQGEYIVRRKGHINCGNIMAGDEVALWGHFRAGTFIFQRGLSLRTIAQIRLQRSYSWVFLLVNIGVLITLICLFYQPLHDILLKLMDLKTLS